MRLDNVADGLTRWSETYDRLLDDILAEQDEIARSVAAEMKVTLQREDEPSSQTRLTTAYNACLQGRFFFERRSKDDLSKAAGYFAKAVDLDPGYAQAWVGLAVTYMRQAD